MPGYIELQQSIASLWPVPTDYGIIDSMTFKNANYEAIGNPRHEAHKELLDWCGGSFDPAKFDLRVVNRALAKVKA